MRQKRALTFGVSASIMDDDDAEHNDCEGQCYNELFAPTREYEMQQLGDGRTDCKAVTAPPARQAHRNHQAHCQLSQC